MLRDNNGIYDSLKKVPSYTFDEFLSRVNEYDKVEDDEMATSSVAEEKRECNRGNGKFDKMKRKRKEDFSKVSENGYKGVNTVFTKSIHKIMFDIQNKPYFEWPRLVGGNPTARKLS